jgi:hypothetical protein
MGMGARVGALCLAAAVLLGWQARADEYYISKLETPDLRLLYYDPIQTYLTPYVGRAFENSFAYQQKTFDWTPWDKTTVYLRDLSDGGNATASATPFNNLTIDIAPISTVFETYYHGERFFSLMNHELMHVATLDAWNDDDAFWRNLFHGKPQPVTEHPETILYNYLAQPRTLEPRWYREGIAVFMETWMDGGLGRAQGGYDEMVFRAMVRDNAHFYDPLGLESEGVAIDFQTLSNDYLYGTRFDSYLALTYGPEKLVALHKRGNDSKAYYADQFKYIYGKPLDAVWADWVAFEHDWQKKNLAALAKYPLTRETPVTQHGLGSISRTFYDPKTDSLIAGFRPIGQLGNIGLISLKDGHQKKLTDFQGPALYRATSLAYDPVERKAYFTSDNNGFRNLMEVNIDTGATRLLLDHARIGDIAFDPADKSIWGIRHLDGLDTLVRIPAAHDSWNQVITFPYGRALVDLDISPDGTLLSASVSEINGDARIDVYRIDDLLAGQVKAVATLTLGQSIPEGGVFSPDGKYLYASAYYTGVSNIYRLNIATGAFDAVSNTDTGYFRPLAMADGSLIVNEFTGEGFRPVRIEPKPLNDLGTIKFLGTEIVNQYPVLRTWAVSSPAAVPFDSMVTKRDFYKPQDEMTFDGSYPIVEGYRGHVAAGWHVQWEDPLQSNLLSANVSFSPAGDLKDGQELHGDITYRTLDWHFTYWHNNANFYDLFGPTDYSRKGDALLGGYHDILIYDPPQLLEYSIDGGLYSGLDTLPGAQNVEAHDPQIATEKFTITYSNIDHSIGAVDNEVGYRANLTLLGSYAKDEFFPQARAGFDWGVALPWNHTSVWLYSAAGVSGGDRANALDYYYLGSFGNNYVDGGEIKRYRDFESFPGFEIDEIGASDFLKSTLELNLPPVHFEDIGTSSFFLSSARMAAFTGVLVADPGFSTERTVEDVGFQVDWNFTIAVRLPMTLSIGDALGFSQGRLERNEIMVSLKIL